MSNFLVVLLAYHIELTNVFTIHNMFYRYQPQKKQGEQFCVGNSHENSLSYTVIGDSHLVFPH